MIDAGREPRLVDEHLHERAVAGQVSVDDLDRELAGEPPGARAATQVEGRHPAGLEAGDDLDVVDSVSDLEHVALDRDLEGRLGFPSE